MMRDVIAEWDFLDDQERIILRRRENNALKFVGSTNTAIVLPYKKDEAQPSNGVYTLERQIITFPVNETPEPQLGDVIDHNGKSWTITNIERASVATRWRLALALPRIAAAFAASLTVLRASERVNGSGVTVVSHRPDATLGAVSGAVQILDAAESQANGITGRKSRYRIWLPAFVPVSLFDLFAEGRTRYRIVSVNGIDQLAIFATYDCEIEL